MLPLTNQVHLLFRCGPTLRSMDTSRQGRFLSEILYDDQLIVSCQILVVMETQNRMGVVNKLKVDMF